MKLFFEKELKFVLHVLVGMGLFVLIASATAGLGAFVHWLAANGVNEHIVFVLTGVEYLLFLADVLTFVVWIVKSSKHFLVEDNEDE